MAQVRKLKSAMGELSESFSGNTMQDAHEFAAQFMDNLKEEVAKMKEEAEVQLDKEKVNRWWITWRWSGRRRLCVKDVE